MEISSIQSAHVMVLPAPRFMDSPSSQNFSISFSGIAVLDEFTGLPDGEWHHEVIIINVEDMRMNKIMERVNILLEPVAPDSEGYKFVPLQWTLFASFQSVFNAGSAVNAGWEVDGWKIVRGDRTTAGANPDSVKVLEGLQINISVRDKDGTMKKVGYAMELYGYFASIRESEID